VSSADVIENSWMWVDSEAKVEEAREDLDRSSLISLDTEYDSMHYFREKLCLVQVRASKRTYVFDPFNGIDLQFLRPYFADPRLLKVTHAGDNDIRILKRDYGFEFRNIFDTHRAAHMLGSQYLALSSIIEQYLGVEIEENQKDAAVEMGGAAPVGRAAAVRRAGHRLSGRSVPSSRTRSCP